MTGPQGVHPSYRGHFQLPQAFTNENQVIKLKYGQKCEN